MGATAEAGVVLLVCEDTALRRQLRAILGTEFALRETHGVELRSPARLVDAAAAVAVLGDAPDAVEVLAPLEACPAGRRLVLLSGHTDETRLEAAISRLAPVALLPAPPSPAALRLALRRALPLARPGAGAREQQRPAHVLLGVSAAIREVMSQVKQLGATGMPVLIHGETGTGKELVARAIHEHGARAGAAFVAINCGALPDALLESELFGFERGAFTGAERAKRGLFEAAHGGTLFLDEIGDTSPAMQVKLLRAIELQEIRPLGATATRQVDVRVVSATHRDLDALVEDGSFRQDLMFRLNTATIYVPPLRRRPVDIPFLAQHFAEEFGVANARRITLSEDFLQTLSLQEFRGNVRELRNAVERAIALARPDEAVNPATTAGPGNRREAPRGSLRAELEHVERTCIRDALERCDGNRTRAAEALGVSRLGLRQKMRRLGLEPAPG